MKSKFSTNGFPSSQQFSKLGLRFFLLIAIFMLSISMVEADLEDDLAHHWTFDSDYDDDFGSVDFDNTNTDLLRDGIQGKSVTSDTNGQFIDMQNSGDIVGGNGTSGTIAYWMYIDDNIVNAILFAILLQMMLLLLVVK